VIILGLVLVSVAAAFHVYVFVLESLRWTAPRTRAAFGVGSAEEAEATRLLAFNQGFYNLFLAVGAIVGVVLVVAGGTAEGYALIVLAGGSMAAAGVVLAVSRPRLLRAALLQLLPPALGLAALGIGALLR
jgi:putative membrane protein